MNKLSFGIAVLSAATFTFAAKAPKSAEKYYSDAAFQYIENRLPTAEITCKEGLQYYPDDAKLQMLADRIEESKNEQQKQNQQNNSSQDKQNQDQNQEQNSDKNSPENSQSENQERNQNSEGQSSAGENSAESSSSQGSENSDADNGSGESSSDSRGSSASEQNAPEESSDSSGENEEVPPGQMSPQEASQLLKDFDEEHGERKPWKPAKGMARPEKDW